MLTENMVTTNGLDPDKMTAAQRLDELAGQAKGFTVMLDVNDIGAILKCSLRTVYRLIDSGRMPPPVRLGGLIRWSPAVIDEWLAKGCPSCRKQLPR